MLAGSTVGVYRIGRHLGSGATSAVYAATAPDGRPVAVKVLHEVHTGHLDLALRFFNERRIASLCTHPGVVRIHDAGWLAKGRPYLAMELLGAPLCQRLRAPLPLGRTMALTEQIAAGAAALHRAGVVHRDLAPANVMFVAQRSDPADSAERVKIADLGLAKLGGQAGEAPVSTLRTDVLGTMEYRAPEAWMSAKEVDDRADVYSLGVLLYQMAAGRRPFEAERESVLMDLQLFCAPVPLTGLPPALWALIGSMLAKARSDRPSMAEVVVTLRHIQEDVLLR